MSHIVLPALPYDKDALDPHVSARTLDFHHGKHHAAYVNKTNELIKGTKYEAMSLVDIIKAAAGQQSETVLFNNAAQVWNHTFFWSCMRAKGGGAPTGRVAELIQASFGDVAKFKEEFKAAAISQFGSGWAWLVFDGSKLSITKTANAATPLTQPGHTALFTVDVWEHAYYLDYQNRRPDFVGAVLDHVMNWDFVAENLKNHH